MEEQNYNMVDDVQGTGDSSFNNGVGEKAQKEAAKREQEQPAARISLKARLAEKKHRWQDRIKTMMHRKTVKIIRGRCKQ